MALIDPILVQHKIKCPKIRVHKKVKDHVTGEVHNVAVMNTLCSDLEDGGVYDLYLLSN